jgi:sugar/nucleoside kinase (ribokinase family)
MDILGIGNALLDIFGFSDEDLALSLGLHPNRGTHVSPERLDELLLAVPNPIFVSGGTAANALKTSAALGLDCAFVGCIGTEDREDDRWARLFTADLSDARVEAILERRTIPTGRCLVIHMPGSMKSIACSPGAAPKINPEQITAQLISKARQVFVDGQILRNPDVFGTVDRLCRDAGVPLAVDVASTDIAREKSAVIGRLLAESGATVFLNEDEARALASALEGTVPSDLSGLSPDARCDAIFSRCVQAGSGAGADTKAGKATIVVKLGERGVRCWSAEGKTEIAAEAVDHPLDDTGAGDTFAGAFLAARLQGLGLAECLESANLAARASLFAPGTRLEADSFDALKKRFPLFARG